MSEQSEPKTPPNAEEASADSSNEAPEPRRTGFVEGQGRVSCDFDRIGAEEIPALIYGDDEVS